jgi:hypothetical protein
MTELWAQAVTFTAAVESINGDGDLRGLAAKAAGHA